jgi:hypothetical protein
VYDYSAKSPYDNNMTSDLFFTENIDLKTTQGVLLLFVFFALLVGAIIFVEVIKIPILALFVMVLGFIFGFFLYFEFSWVVGIVFIIMSLFYGIARVIASR